MIRKIKYYIFGIIISSLFLCIVFIKPSNAFLFKNAMGDCSGRTNFMYNKLYQNNSEADVVFFGSSRTMNGIIDSSTTTNKLLNLGYCRFGRNLDAFFIEEYLKTHHPSKIIIEVREDEGDNSHPLTPFLLPVSKIAEGFYTFDASIFNNLYNKFLCNLKFLRRSVFSKTDTAIFMNDNEPGFWENKSKIDDIQFNKERKKDSLNLKIEIRKNLNRNSEFYFEKINRASQQKKIKLYFLFMPSYGNLYKKPNNLDAYTKYGKCIIPPDSIFCNKTNFADYNHLNKKGAASFSNWLNRFLD